MSGTGEFAFCNRGIDAAPVKGARALTSEVMESAIGNQDLGKALPID
jgi:hypothetical protein